MIFTEIEKDDLARVDPILRDPWYVRIELRSGCHQNRSCFLGLTVLGESSALLQFG